MLYEIKDVTVSLGAEVILSHINFEIHGTEKIAVVGRNGAGKMTLLRLIAGELEPDRDDRRQGPGICSARTLTVGMHRQQVVDESLPLSGGEQMKAALLEQLLAQPDILLLDEPTNHLDMETSLWLEDYLKSYPKAVVMVSHDRFFLDRVADVVYDLEGKALKRYVGNYTSYKEEKRKNFAITMKAYERQQEEIKRLEDLIERFKHKPKKAAFARSRKKILERMEKIEKPVADTAHIFTGEIVPLSAGSKWVCEAEHLKIGYDRALLELGLRIKKGQKIGIIGPNGVGKSTFLKTVGGLLPKISGKCTLGNGITVGYFDQHSADISSDKTVFEHFHDVFPSLIEKEVRSVLGSYLFGGRMAAKPVNGLSGGEKARLVLAELLYSRPNFLILDEPTNHMDIPAKETLESAFRAYKGTILFVSHDRYFIQQVAESILIIENGQASYYPFGYAHYVEKKSKLAQGGSLASLRLAEEQAMIADMRAVPKPERHQLKEVSTEDAYVDWQLRLAGEKLAAAQAAYEQAYEAAQSAVRAWDNVHLMMAASTPMIVTDAAPLDHRRTFAVMECEDAWKQWHEACMLWYDIYQDLDL